MTNSNATVFRNVIVDLPDFPAGTITFSLRTYFAAEATEGFPQKGYSLTLSATGQGTQALAVPSTGAWLYEVGLPDGNTPQATLAAGADIQLTAWLSAALSTETANDLTDSFVLKAGDAMTGLLTLSGAPTADLHASTKKYVDDTAQPLDAGLTDLAGLPVTDGNIPVGDGANWVAESGATARASLGAAALGANTFTGDQDLDGNAITNYVEGVTTVSPTTSYAISMLDEIVVITLTDNLSVSFTDITAGASVTVHFIQDATGSRVPSFSGLTTPGGAGLTLSTAPGARDKFVFDSYNGTVVDGHEVGLDMS